MIKTEEIRMALQERYSRELEKLLNERHEAVRNCLMTEPNRTGVAVWLHDGQFILEPVWKYGLTLLPDRPGKPLVVFGVGEYLRLEREDIKGRILSALEERIRENIER
jgi:hypothetical protein